MRWGPGMSDRPGPLTESQQPAPAASAPVEADHPLGFVRRFGAVSETFFERARALLSMREDNLFLLLAVVIGLFSGLAVVCFRIAIDLTRLMLLGSAAAPGPLRVILVPTVMGFVLAFLMLRVFPRVQGSGVTHTKSALYIYDGYIPSARSSENSSLVRWPSAAGSLSVPKIRRCRWGRGLRPRSDDDCGYRAKKYG